MKIKKPALFNNRNLVKLLSGQIISNVCAHTIFFSTINILFGRSQSTAAMGVLTALYYLPGAALGIISGTVVDKTAKRLIFIGTGLSQALVAMAFLTIFQEPFLAFAFIFFYSLLDELYNPAVGVILPNFVEKKNLGAVNTIWLFASEGSIIIGSILASLFFKIFPLPQLVFPTIAVLLLIGIIPILTIPKDLIDYNHPFPYGKLNINLENFLSEIKSGLLYIKNNQFVLLPVLLLGLSRTLISMSLAITPTLAQVLNINVTDAPLFIIAPTALGALIGGYKISRITKANNTRKKRLIRRGFITSGAGLILLVALSFLPIVSYLAWLCFIFIGFSFIFIIVPTQTLIQEKTHFDLRGRVYGTLNMFVSLLSLVPLLVLVSLVDLLGVRWLLLTTAGGLFALAYFLNQKNQQILDLLYSDV